MEVESLRDAEVVAQKICELGPKAVVIKGGHLRGKNAVDLLYYRGNITKFTAPKLDVKTTHGTGCSFSAAIVAGLAKKMSIPEAVENAKRIVTSGIRFGLKVGRGYGPVNPMAYLYRESSRYDVLMNLERAKTLIEATPEIAMIIPEVGMNIAMAIPYAESINDVAAIDGRIVKTSEGVRAAGNPKFGCSSHLAKYILEVTKHDETKTGAINTEFSDDILKALEKRGMTISLYDRRKEPEETKKVEGMTIPWGVKEAIKKVGKAPDALYHKGDIGKEPMIVIFGEQAYDLAKLSVQLAKEIRKK
jgi:hydroxymethylpyrimidine/phosphomethylpyrimidine kinase